MVDIFIQLMENIYKLELTIEQKKEYFLKYIIELSLKMNYHIHMDFICRKMELKQF